MAGIRRVEQATRDAERRLRDLVDELRLARLRAGLSQSGVARMLGVSPSWLSRAERSKGGDLTLPTLARWAAIVGLVLRASLLPLGAPVRDAPQLRLIGRIQRRLHRSWRQILEAGMPIHGDLRAVDLVLSIPGCVIAVEAITRLTDLQAQLRAAQLKARDLGAQRLILLVADSPANRLALRLAGDVIRTHLPLGSRSILAALAAGRDPGGDGVVIL